MEGEDFRTFEAINLILPWDVSASTPTGNNDQTTLQGYANLKKMRDKTAEFRAGYKNWRMKGAKGAKGETSDVFSAKHTQVSNIAPLPEIPQRKSLLESAESLRRPSITHATEISHLDHQDDHDELHHDELPFKHADPNVLQSEINPENWLRFYYNPHTPLDVPFARHHRIQNAKLPTLPANIRRPTYPRAPQLVQNWILHIGVGGFHRSHQAVYLDDILEKLHGAKTNPKKATALSALSSSSASSSLSWGLCGVGLLPFDGKMRDALECQDYLYTVLTRSTSKNEARIIGSIMDFLLVPEATTEQVDAKLLDDKLKIVSLTITEKGYCQRTDGNLDLDHAGIRADLDSHLAKPTTAVGFILKGIILRYLHKKTPFTVQSCDNMPENGHVAKKMVLQMAQAYLSRLQAQADKGALMLGAGSLRPVEFLEYVESQVRFPSAMVDRITPVTQAQHREILLRDFGLDDEWPVIAEEFSQWVLEDDFPAGRPAWESVGVLMVHDVGAYEAMKLRLLNGGHSAMCYLSVLAGFSFVDDALADVRVSQFLRAYMDEMTPTVMTTVQIEVERYKDKVVERFSNRMIKDALARICEDGSTKIFSTMRIPLLFLAEHGKHTHCAALSVAAYLRFMTGVDESGRGFTFIKDAKKDVMQDLARDAVKWSRCEEVVGKAVAEIFGEDFVQATPLFMGHVCLSLEALKRFGACQVLASGSALHALTRNFVLSEPRRKALLNLVLEGCEAEDEEEDTQCNMA